jgi:hypothetical protein
MTQVLLTNVLRILNVMLQKYKYNFIDRSGQILIILPNSLLSAMASKNTIVGLMPSNWVTFLSISDMLVSLFNLL